jgi:hypothetical protein
MKRSLWFDASMLALILIVSAVASTLESQPNGHAAATSQIASATPP